MKIDYLKIMNQVVEVYSCEQIEDYIGQVQAREIWEHGFPRLTANLGILLAYGYQKEKQHYFEIMMELCCQQIPTAPITCKHRSSDFSVREILFCIMELEKSGIYGKDIIERWKQAMSAVDPYKIYRMIAPKPPIAVDNWAAFNASGEQVRNYAGLADTTDYIDNQIASQMLSFDSNGMYRDPNEPMVYDFVTRGVLSTALFFGYAGTHRQKLEQHLERSGKLSLMMQSVSGEMPFGGRSNQFLHNEAHLALVFEYEALRHKNKNDLQTAGQFKSAAALALSNLIGWLDNHPGHHIKNLFPVETKIGCEEYGYYNKYMITVASFLYIAYLFCDDTIAQTLCPAASEDGYVWQTEDHFHKLFCKHGPYYLALDTKADPHYDASGIGRIHRANAPSSICISTSVSKKPNYTLPFPNPSGFSLCGGFLQDGIWRYCWDESCDYKVLSKTSSKEACEAVWQCTLDGRVLTHICRIYNDHITLKLMGEGQLCWALPVFTFDGENHTEILQKLHKIQIHYLGWNCIYKTNGVINAGKQLYTNRNGNYLVYQAMGEDEVTVEICIEQNTPNL